MIWLIKLTIMLFLAFILLFGFAAVPHHLIRGEFLAVVLWVFAWIVAWILGGLLAEKWDPE